jgi:hypothetical protein
MVINITMLVNNITVVASCWFFGWLMMLGLLLFFVRDRVGVGLKSD